MSSTTAPPYQKLTPSSPTYEQTRTRFFNARVPPAHPSEIHLPTTTAEVSAILQEASARNLKVGVRSGGHNFYCPSLIPNGLLIDTKNLNKTVTYDARTKTAAFSPAHTVEDLANAFAPLGRFFPWGHSRDVAVGGFLLAGGQGCFARGWGYTSEDWVVQLEVVVPSGEVVICSRTQNADLFWAAPGSGRGFFGVVTRVWGRTVAAKRLFDVTVIVDATDIFKPLLKYVLETSESVPKYGTDLFFCTFRSDMEAPGDGSGADEKRIMFVINETVYADSLEEARVLVSPWDTLPEAFAKFQVQRVPLTERSWEDWWTIQAKFQPQDNGERWNVDSILTDPKKSIDELIEAITPALYELPTRLSTSTVCPMDYFPDGVVTALSVPHKTYVSTMQCWRDPANDEAQDAWLNRVYKKAATVSSGIYASDLRDGRRSPVYSNSVLKKWLEIRAKWDPEERFIGYRAFANEFEEGWRTKL